MLLNHVATVISGYAFREAIKSDGAGRICVLQAKDIAQGQPIVDVSNLVKISLEAAKPEAFLKKGDIVLVARGMQAGAFKSTIFLSEATHVLASSSVFIIRVTSANVISEYISCYLNSTEGQNALSQIVSGSYIGALPRNKLAEIKIPIPPPKAQKNIVDLHNNIRQQQKILERKKAIRQNLLNATFRNLATE